MHEYTKLTPGGLLPVPRRRYASQETLGTPHAMQLLDVLSSHAKAHCLPFMVIGGHALNAHGIGRQTADLDLLVCREDADAWLTALTALGYLVRHRHEAFLQFEPPDIAQWPVDLVLVDRATYGVFAAAGRQVKMDSPVTVEVPSALHLIALKLHALKQAGAVREVQDISDIVGLIKLERIDVTSATFREFCLKYGSAALYERIAEQAARHP